MILRILLVTLLITPLASFSQRLKLHELMILYDKGMERLDGFVSSNKYGSEKIENQSIMYVHEKNNADSIYTLEIYNDGTDKIKQIICYSNKPQANWDLKYYLKELTNNGFVLDRHFNTEGKNSTTYFFKKDKWWVMLEKHPEEIVTMRDRKPSKTLSSIILFLFKE